MFPGPAGGMAPGLGTRARPTAIDARPGKNLRRISRLFALAVTRRRAADVRPWLGTAAAMRLRPADVSAAGRAASEQRRHRDWNRDRGQRAESTALRALATSECRTLAAFAQVRSQSAFLVTGQPPVELARDRKLGFAARERGFELFAQSAARTEDQGFDR